MRAPYRLFGVVGTEVDDNYVGVPSQHLSVFPFLHIGLIAVFEQRALADTIVEHLIYIAEKGAQLRRIFFGFGKGGIFGDAVAHASHADALLIGSFSAEDMPFAELSVAIAVVGCDRKA